ncbi:branched-chain amino acid ABC transporter substrate-binding protein [Pseudonocardia phyllosphaerae]|uniref:branched-chain amino acid ABC transporter substrate-binding protein n=1 Tax=Pseudonocardia phyllosphaerae TaxID=3390502 RepID=UPI00397B315F
MTAVPAPDGAANAAGNGQASCPATTLAFAGALTGGNARPGIVNGAQLAVDQHNRANPNCQVQLKRFDTGGTAEKAPEVVTRLITDSSVLGAVGLPLSAESKATGAIFEEGGLTHLTPSATDPVLTRNNWSTFFRVPAGDAVQGPAAATFMTGRLGARKVCVVQDDSGYANGLAGAVSKALGPAGANCRNKVTAGQKDFSPVISKVVAAKPDVVLYAGYGPDGARFDKQLTAKGFRGQFVGSDAVLDDAFVRAAGTAADNAFFTCACAPGALLPGFADAYKGIAGGAEPPAYSAEAYDAATVLLKAIDAGARDRGAVKEFVRGYRGPGYSRELGWDPAGDPVTRTVHGYKVEKGRIAYVGPIG